MVPDFVRLGFTAATPLPNQGFPARFLDQFFNLLRIAGSNYLHEPPMGIMPLTRTYSTVWPSQNHSSALAANHLAKGQYEPTPLRNSEMTFCKVIARFCT